jgi:hypothetical protein
MDSDGEGVAMSIEHEAAKDLSLGESEAEQVSGGKKTKKAAHKAAPAAKTYPVGYINVSTSSSSAPVDDSGTTAWTDDCVDPSV